MRCVSRSNGIEARYGTEPAPGTPEIRAPPGRDCSVEWGWDGRAGRDSDLGMAGRGVCPAGGDAMRSIFTEFRRFGLVALVAMATVQGADAAEVEDPASGGSRDSPYTGRLGLPPRWPRAGRDG